MNKIINIISAIIILIALFLLFDYNERTTNMHKIQKEREYAYSIGQLYILTGVKYQYLPEYSQDYILGVEDAIEGKILINETSTGVYELSNTVWKSERDVKLESLDVSKLIIR